MNWIDIIKKSIRNGTFIYRRISGLSLIIATIYLLYSSNNYQPKILGELDAYITSIPSTLIIISVVIGILSMTKFLNKLLFNFILIIIANYLFFELFFLALFLQKNIIK